MAKMVENQKIDDDDGDFTVEKFIKQLKGLMGVDDDVYICLLDSDDIFSAYLNRCGEIDLTDSYTRSISITSRDICIDRSTWDNFKDLVVITSLELTYLKTNRTQLFRTGLYHRDESDFEIRILVKGLSKRVNELENEK